MDTDILCVKEVLQLAKEMYFSKLFAKENNYYFFSFTFTILISVFN